MSDIIAVVTSTPSSMHNAEPALLSILSQTQQPSVFRWHLPKFFKRTQNFYDPVPQWVRKYPQIEIINCEDDGPITKVTPILDDIGHKRLIIFDDDVVYHPNTIEILDRAQRTKPNSVVGTIGHTFKYVPFHTSKRQAFGSQAGISWFNQVSVLLGTGMLLIPSDFFGKLNRTKLMQLVDTDSGFALNDDHTIAHLAFVAQIPMFVVPCPDATPYVQNQLCLTGTNATMQLEIRMLFHRKLTLPTAEILAAIVIVFLLVKFCKQVVLQKLA